MEYKEKELLYLQAKESYYAGSPIMTDTEFDELEEQLKNAGFKVILVVGSNAKGDKFRHLTPMTSLAKIQFKRDYQPLDEFDSFLEKVKSVSGDFAELEFTPKYDGNACNLIYEKGKLVKAISRGDGTEGQDLTEKVKNIVPQTIKMKQTLEVRGEILLDLETFNQYYSDFKNPRNLVAGILGRDDMDDIHYESLDRLTFMAFELRFVYTRLDHDHTYDYPTRSTQVLSDLGFNKKYSFVDYSTIADVDLVEKFEIFQKHRANSNFLLDGFVCKVEENYRKAMGETSHHPKWALAIKFPPKSAITKVADVEWNLGKTGVLTPVGLLEPVDLDGSTVSRVTLHNYEWITNKGVCPGATVEIVKSGDIIPAIVNVLEESTEGLQTPTEYQGLEVQVDENGKNLIVVGAENLDEFGAKKLHRGISVLGIQYIGGAMAERLYRAGITEVMNLYDPAKMNEDFLIQSGEFKAGRELERLLTEVNNLQEVDLWKVINSLQFDRVGKSLSKLFAKYMVGISVDWAGFEKAVVAKLTETDSTYRTLIDVFCTKLENAGIKVLHPTVVLAEGSIEFTGSPKEFGFKTKADFLDFIKEKGLSHEKLTKDSKYLVTDSHDSTSSKMKKAEKLNVKIVTYGELIEILK